MKHIVLTLCLLLAAVTAHAAGSDDFATRFLTLHGKTADISSHTVSPQMMARIIAGDTSDELTEAERDIVSQIKTIRVLTTTADAATAHRLFTAAEQLATKNARRYRLHSASADHNVYIRRHGHRLVEIVVARQKEGGTFFLLDLTGEMDDNFLEKVQKS